MKTFAFQPITKKARWAGALFAFIASSAILAAVVAVFASASGELDPILAMMKAPPPASAVAVQAPARRLRS